MKMTSAMTMMMKDPTMNLPTILNPDLDLDLALDPLAVIDGMTANHVTDASHENHLPLDPNLKVSVPRPYPDPK
jgi:hypothetical protein